ncbi:Hypothetical protein NocV09_02100360 [Nannochloropsis oceanica]
MGLAHHPIHTVCTVKNSHHTHHHEQEGDASFVPAGAMKRAASHSKVEPLENWVPLPDVEPLQLISQWRDELRRLTSPAYLRASTDAASVPLKSYEVSKDGEGKVINDFFKRMEV